MISIVNGRRSGKTTEMFKVMLEYPAHSKVFSTFNRTSAKYHMTTFCEEYPTHIKTVSKATMSVVLNDGQRIWFRGKEIELALVEMEIPVFVDEYQFPENVVAISYTAMRHPLSFKKSNNFNKEDMKELKKELTKEQFKLEILAKY